MAQDFKAVVKRFMGWLEQIAQGDSTKTVEPASENVETSSSLGRVLLGPLGALGEPYFPTDLIGGCCPRVVGQEEDIAWNAAAESADSERVHIVWQAQGDKIWYLAVRSSEMASYANTWCPFASLLPGMKDAAVPPACYTYYSDTAATMMTVLPDGLQIHRGTTAVVQAKAERMARELGGIPVIDMVPERIEKLMAMPWYSMSLFEERSRRVLAAVSVFSALAILLLVVMVWFFATMATISARYDISSIRERTEQKSEEFIKQVRDLRSSPLREQLAKFTDLNDGLLAINGWLDIYQINADGALWRAIVPTSVTANRISDLGGQMLETAAQGVVIGNSPRALKLGVK